MSGLGASHPSDPPGHGKIRMVSMKPCGEDPDRVTVIAYLTEHLDLDRVYTVLKDDNEITQCILSKDTGFLYAKSGDTRILLNREGKVTVFNAFNEQEAQNLISKIHGGE
ncbi:MAG: hypothetical protein V3T23_00315 [Nitrososphaerales archaeon]|jgi:ArsR family metal-binding transcriptional regulator